MKNVWLIVTLLVVCVNGVFTQSIAETVTKFENSKSYEIVYDKFKKETRISYRGRLFSLPLKKARIGKWYSSQLTMEVLASIPDDAKGGEADCSLYFSGGSTKILFNRPILRMLLDETLIEIESDEIDFSVIFPLEPKVVKQISEAKVVELQLRGYEARWDDSTVTAFSNIASLLTPK